MNIDKVRGVQIEEVTPVHRIHQVPSNSVTDEWKALLSLPVVHPRIVHDDFYGPNGKMLRTNTTVSFTA